MERLIGGIIDSFESVDDSHNKSFQSIFESAGLRTQAIF
jgi:hypothetical protein